jgi:hypothetical protein
MVLVEWEQKYLSENNDLLVKKLQQLEETIIEAVRWLRTRPAAIRHTVSIRLSLGKAPHDSIYNLHISSPIRNRPVISLRKQVIMENGEISEAIIGMLRLPRLDKNKLENT